MPPPDTQPQRREFIGRVIALDPAALELHPHALAPVADLPVLEVVSGLHIITDLTLGLGKVAFDYLR